MIFCVRAALVPAVELIRTRVPGLVSIHLFGSVARRDETLKSDVDLAFLATLPLPALARWDLQQDHTVTLHQDVDLLDLRGSSTVMRVRVLEDSELLLDIDPTARAVFEATALGAYARLNFERRYILEDVRRRGQIYG